VIIYVQDVLDDRFSSPEELTAQLGVPVLTMVRKLDPLPGTGLETVHTHAMPNAVESEAFRTLRTALSLTGSACERLLICSSEPGDGKTTITANLSTAFAQAGKRTLVIDADLRRPGFTTLLNLKGVPGVAEIITSDQPPLEIAPQLVQHTAADGLDVLPVGLRRPNPAELLSSQAFVELLAWADSVYDRVIVDCPPVLAVSDAQIVGQLVDGAILVVRPEKNHRRAVIRAVECFRSSGCHVLGVVANALSADAQSYGYGGYGYGYGYGYTYGHDESEEITEHEYEAPRSRTKDSDTIVPRRASRTQAQESIRPRRAA
jgi:capsular exopolysaccharide synthesis family protein